MEWLMARQALLIASAAGAKNAKFRDYIRFHAEDAPEQKPREMTPEAFAALYGARKKEA